MSPMQAQMALLQPRDTGEHKVDSVGIVANRVYPVENCSRWD
jgi:hypothetical protein